MILDAQCLCSDDQAMTTTAPSTNSYDLGAAGINIGEGEPLIAWCQVTGTCVTGTSIAVSVVEDDDSALGSPVTLYSTPAIPQASLVAGYRFKLGTVPETSLRYLGFVYTIVGTFDGASAISAGFTHDVQEGENVN